jgi:hypothetical protein
MTYTLKLGDTASLVFQTISAFFLRYSKRYGVQFESSLPPEFVVSEHAEQRIRERFGLTDKKKMAKMVQKAFYSRQTKSSPRITIAKNRSEYKGKKYKFREMMGRVFIFAYSGARGELPPVKLLVTVF